jgi:hypothetical protein
MHSRNVQLLWGARYSFGPQAESPGDVEVFTGKSGLKIFQRADAFPRAWVVHRVEKEPSRALIGGRAEAEIGSFASRALMTADPPALEACASPDEVAEYRRPAGDSLLVKAKLACRGLVIVSDTFFPGWKAYVDGEPAQIHEVNGAMRGVVAPAGEHTISMRYRPMSVYLGALLTVIGLAAVAAVRLMGK